MNAIPSPKPNRLKRTALRLAVPFAAASVLFAAYWFTRPPELVWWRSPKLHATEHSVKVLIPRGWEVEEGEGSILDTGAFWQRNFSIIPNDRRPNWLRTKLPIAKTDDSLRLHVVFYRHPMDLLAAADREILSYHVDDGHWQASRQVDLDNQHHRAEICYDRRDRAAFKRTYRQICNSLRLE